MQPRVEHFCGFQGVSLAADVWGDEDAWPVLLMHGGGQTRRAWGKTAQMVAEAGWRAVSLDLRGHGDSEWAPNGDYSFTAFTADCVAVASQLGRLPVLVGASLGGVASILAEGNSDRAVASALVIIDITHRNDPQGIARIREFMALGLHGFANLDEATAAIATFTPHRKRRASPEGLRNVLRQRGDGRWYFHWDPKFLQGVRGESMRSEVPSPGFQGPFEAALANIHIPTLLIRGLLSDVVTEAGVREFMEKVPHASVVDVADAGHMVAGDENDAFSRAVVRFLEREVQPRI